MAKGAFTVVVDLPGEGLEWSAATLQVPGSRIEAQVEAVQLDEGRYQVTALVRAQGFPEAALADIVGRLKSRYGAAAIQVLEPGSAQGALLRTRLGVDALESPFVRFLLRFHDQFKAVSAHIEGGRLQVRGSPRAPGTAEQDVMRIQAFLAKLETSGSVRIERDDGP
ncbi:MAG: hypothetical protein AABY18_07035 [Candidatus Thermoplasmatota archaeon]